MLRKLHKSPRSTAERSPNMSAGFHIIRYHHHYDKEKPKQRNTETENCSNTETETITRVPDQIPGFIISDLPTRTPREGSPTPSSCNPSRRRPRFLARHTTSTTTCRAYTNKKRNTKKRTSTKTKKRRTPATASQPATASFQ